MIDGLNNEMYMNSLAVENVFYKYDKKAKLAHDREQIADLDHLEEDVKVEEHVVEHLIHSNED